MGFIEKVTAKYIVQADATQFASKLEEVFRLYFPKSHIRALHQGHPPRINLNFRLVSDVHKLPHFIPDNDPAYSTWNMWRKGDKWEVNLLRGGTFSVKPPPGSYLAMDSLKLGWRNKTGTEEQILKHFSNYLEKAKKAMNANIENVYGDDAQKSIYKEYL